jgi:hypothetical protein
MAFLNDRIYDNGLGVLAGEVNALHLCKSNPSTFAEATGSESVGSATGAALPSVSAPGVRAAGGREVTVGAVTDGSVSATQLATHIALVDTSASRLLVTRALNASQNVTQGNTFTLTSFKIGIPDVAV